MKTFSTNGTGSQQTLSEIESDKMPIYNTMADAEADLANLEEGQLVAIEDTGDELSQPVDTVEAGNLHAVTSNAVAESCCRFPDYAHPITPSSATWVATEDCYISILQVFNYDSSTKIYIDGNVASVYDSQTDLRILAFNGYVKKGQSVAYEYLTNSNICKIFPLI
jgi:hypothetical protein